LPLLRELGVDPEHVVHPGLLGGWGCQATQYQGGHRMKLHANARLSVKGRELLVDRMLTQGWSSAQAAEAAGVSDRTACKWLARFRSEGEQGLLDRPSTPKSSPSRTPDQRIQLIAALRLPCNARGARQPAALMTRPADPRWSICR